MDLVVAAIVLGFVGLIGLVTGALAKRKGYKFLLWFFAGGIIGLIALCFLPFANAPELSDMEQRARVEKGNIVGRNIALFNLIVVLFRAMG